MGLREMQVYQFMSNIIKQMLNAKGAGQDWEGGLQAHHGEQKWCKGARGPALPSPTQPAVAPSPKPASRRD